MRQREHAVSGGNQVGAVSHPQRGLVVREYVGKQGHVLEGMARTDSFFAKLRDVVMRALYRAGVLRSPYGGFALDLQIRGLARKALDQAMATPAESGRGQASGSDAPARSFRAADLRFSREEGTPPGQGEQESKGEGAAREMRTGNLH